MTARLPVDDAADEAARPREDVPEAAHSDRDEQARRQAAVLEKLDELYSRGPWDYSAFGEAEIAVLRKFGIVS